MDEYGRIPSARVFYDYCEMDANMVRTFATKLADSMVGYVHALSGFMQGESKIYFMFSS